MIDHSVLYQETSLNYFHYLALRRLKISNRTDRRVKECVRKNSRRDVRWCLGKRKNMKLTETAWEIFSEYELILRTNSRSIYSIRALWDDLTHTSNDSSSCLCSLRDLQAFMSFNPSIHTHTHTNTTEGEVRRVSAVWVQTHTQKDSRATGFIHKWHLSDLN